MFCLSGKCLTIIKTSGVLVLQMGSHEVIHLASPWKPFWSHKSLNLKKGQEASSRSSVEKADEARKKESKH
jgi:hypothetical protein